MYMVGEDGGYVEQLLPDEFFGVTPSSHIP
jgi:hypothetical protein